MTVTPMERRILLLIVQGETNIGIGHRLGCSQHTIKRKIMALCRTFAARSRVELAVAAIFAGVVTAEGYYATRREVYHVA